MKSLLLNKILPPILVAFVRLWCGTLRIKILNPEMEREISEKPGRAIYTLWHSQLLMFLYRFRDQNRYTLLISPSKDGDLLASVARGLGYQVVRASSFKKTVPGTRECLHLLKKEAKIVIIADGSRGPRHIAQAGSIQLSRLTGAPIYTLAGQARSRYEFPSWDRFILPLPFARVTLNYGVPYTIDADADKEEIERQQEALTRQLDQISEACQSA